MFKELKKSSHGMIELSVSKCFVFLLNVFASGMVMYIVRVSLWTLKKPETITGLGLPLHLSHILFM